jgi:DNA-binding response OmpR family regulator
VFNLNILIVEDDLHLAEALKQIVEKESYIADVVHDGMDGLYYASNNEYDVILLDVMLPKMNGYDVIKMLRKQHVSTPTLMLTAKSEILDRVAGLDSGADDYLTKPFAPEELLARLRAISRRQGDVILDTIEIENLSLNLQNQNMSFKEKSVSLSNKEFQIMQLLMQNHPMIISKEKIINKIWGATSNADDNNVEAYISFLRKKLFYLKADLLVNIITLRQVGYKLDKVNQDD